MSEGIERNKIKQDDKPTSSITSMSNIRQLQQSSQNRKHVIFSSYEGVVSHPPPKEVKTTKKLQPYDNFDDDKSQISVPKTTKVPPIYPNGVKPPF